MSKNINDYCYTQILLISLLLVSIILIAEVVLDSSIVISLFFFVRPHLIECFEERKLSLFLKIVKEYISRPSRRLYVIKLFCLCYMPEEYDVMMILCDKCHKWFHCSCVCINPTEVPDVWYCKTCY